MLKKLTAVFLCASVLFTTASVAVAGTGGLSGGDSLDKGCLDLSSKWYQTAENTASLTVSSQAVNTVRPEIFGDNLSWRGNGYDMWNSVTNAPDTKLLEMLKASGVTQLRYPGGIEGDYFHWNESVGDVGGRTAQIDPFSADWPTSAGADGEKYVAIFGPDEFQELVEAAGIRATIQLNAGNGTPQEAADWVRHCLDNGLDVASFAVGNEVHFAEERVAGVTVTKTPEEYIAFYNDVYDALGDLADGVNLGCISIPDSQSLARGDDWDSKILSALGEKIDFVDIHVGYAPYGFSESTTSDSLVECFMASSQWIASLIQEEKASMQANLGANYDNVDLQITEYGPISPGQEEANSVAGAIFLASFFNTVLQEPKITAANHLPLINHFEAPNLLGAWPQRNAYWDNAQTYVFRMYSAQAGRQVLDAELTGCGTFSSSKVGLIPEVTGVPLAESTVYFDPDSQEGSIFLINKSLDENMEFSIQLPFENARLTGAQELWNINPMAENNFYNQSAVTLNDCGSQAQGTSVSGGEFRAVTKPVSLVRIDFTTKAKEPEPSSSGEGSSGSGSESSPESSSSSGAQSGGSSSCGSSQGAQSNTSGAGQSSQNPSSSSGGAAPSQGTPSDGAGGQGEDASGGGILTSGSLTNQNAASSAIVGTASGPPASSGENHASSKPAEASSKGTSSESQQSEFTQTIPYTETVSQAWKGLVWGGVAILAAIGIACLILLGKKPKPKS